MARHFKIDSPLFPHHYTVQAPSGSTIYYIQESTFTPGKPDLTLHTGTTSNNAILAVAHLSHFTGDCKIGLGNPRSSGVRWEELTKASMFTASEYNWAMTLPVTAQKTTMTAVVGSTRRGFVWKRTHSVAASGASFFALSSGNYKLLDARTNETLAVFTKSMSPLGCGTLQINVDYGADFDLMVLMTCLSLYEKARRAKRKRAGSNT